MKTLLELEACVLSWEGTAYEHGACVKINEPITRGGSNCLSWLKGICDELALRTFKRADLDKFQGYPRTPNTREIVKLLDEYLLRQAVVGLGSRLSPGEIGLFETYQKRDRVACHVAVALGSGKVMHIDRRGARAVRVPPTWVLWGVWRFPGVDYQ